MKEVWVWGCTCVSILILTLSAHATLVDSMPPNGQTGAATGDDQTANIPAVVLGDTNGDGVVDAADFIALKRNMGKVTSGSAQAGDFNGSGTVDYGDLNVMAAGLHQPAEVPASAPVPEPLTMGLFALGMLAAARRLRGRVAMPH